RDLVALVPTFQDGCLAAWGQRPPHGRRQLKARFIEQHQVRVAVAGCLHDTRELGLFPAAYVLLVPLLGLGLRFLAGPTEAAFEDLSDMLGVIGDAEVTEDYLLDTGRRPQIVGPAVLVGALQQEGLQSV